MKRTSLACLGGVIAFACAAAASETEPDKPPIDGANISVGAESLSLDLLLEEVQRRNPSMEIALTTWRAALARFPQVTALDDPVLSYSVAPLTLDRPRVGSGGSTREIGLSRGALPALSFSRTDRSGRGFGVSSGPPINFTFFDEDAEHRIDIGQIVEISQMFPWPGKRRVRGTIALYEAEGARADTESVRQGLIHAMKVAYYEYWYVHRALEINAFNQRLLQELQDIAETKYASGSASKQDALQAEVEREELSHQAIELYRMREVTHGRINALLNRNPETHLPAPPTEIDPPADIPEAQSLYDAALRNRPELSALQYRVEAKEAGIELARKEFRPDFRVMASYDTMWDNEEQRFMIGAELNIPIQLGRRRAALDEAQAERARSDAELARAASEVSFEVKEAREMVNENCHLVDLYEERLLPATEENLASARSGYAVAEVDFLAVISAQKFLMDTSLKRHEALAAYHQAKADLELAIGGPLEQSLDVSEGDTP